MTPATRKHAFLDRIEGDEAVLLVDDLPVPVPRRLLPPEAREGDWLTLSLEIDSEETGRRTDAIRGRHDRLGRGDDGGDFSL